MGALNNERIKQTEERIHGCTKEESREECGCPGACEEAPQAPQEGGSCSACSCEAGSQGSSQARQEGVTS
jgi:hypothetical protein